MAGRPSRRVRRMRKLITQCFCAGSPAMQQGMIPHERHPPSQSAPSFSAVMPTTLLPFTFGRFVDVLVEPRGFCFRRFALPAPTSKGMLHTHAANLK